MNLPVGHWLPESSKTRNAGDRVIKDLVVPMELKADVDRREIIAYASVFDVLDRQGDIVRPGAFAKTIREDGDRVKVLYQHDTHRPIGLPRHMEEDSKGLLTVSKISKIPDGDLALQLVADGVLDRYSIGFEVIRASEFEDEELRATLRGVQARLPMHNLEELKLWEYSPVTFAANDSANVLAVRAAFGGWLPVIDSRWPSPVVEPEETRGVGSETSKAIEIGSFVAFGDSVGKVLSVSADGYLTIQVYSGSVPTDETAEVLAVEATEIDAPVSLGAGMDEDEEDEGKAPELAEDASSTCPTCGKSRDDAPSDDTKAAEVSLEAEANLIHQLRSYARS